MDETILDPSVLSGLNSSYIADLYEKWLDDPNNVDSNWRGWFENLKLNGSSNDVPNWAKGKPYNPEIINDDKKNHSLSADEVRKASIDSLRAVMMIRAYRARGHLEAKTDPLELAENIEHPELSPEFYGFTKEDYDRPIFIDNVLGLEPGDEIGLFDAAGVLESVEAGETPEYGYTLVGAGVWTGELLSIVGVESVDLSDFGGPVLNGYVSGNPIVYKVWKASENTEYNANVTYSNGSGDWGAILTVVSMLEPVFSVTQDLELDPYTFNMASLNVVPEDDAVSTVFGSLDLLLVKNDDSEYYVPDFGVNQIGNTEVGEGYKVFLTGANSQSFSVEGMPVDLSTMLSLDPFTFNMLGFLPQDCMSTSDVFAGYEDQILIVKNDASEYYVPAFGVETLSEMCPGDAYAVFLNGSEDIDFMYPADGLASITSTFIDDYKLEAHRDDVALTGESHLVLFESISGTVEQGDILRAYANGELVGSINIVNAHINGTMPIDLVAHGSVDLTEYNGPVLDGYIKGDEINLSYYSRSTRTEYNVEYDFDLNAYGEGAEMSVGGITVLNELENPTSFKLSQNYPNPFNPSTMIEYNVEHSGLVSLKVYDIMGRLVRTLIDGEFKSAGNADGYRSQWNGVDDKGQQVSAGLYIYRLESGSMAISNKMILLK